MNDDWWLKFQRAEKHMVDIKEKAGEYESSQPYSFTRIRLPDSKNEIRHRFRITKQPSPMIAIMLGDFVHNLRSALDYIIVASVPRPRRGKAGFPIVYEDIFATDINGDFVVNDANLRKKFETATKGLHPDARAFVIASQPYNHGVDAYRMVVGIISRLENADKHRQLITIGSGGREFTVNFIAPDLPDHPIKWRERILATGADFFKDNTVVTIHLPPHIPRMDGSPTKPSEMKVHFSGTAKILVKVTRIGGNQRSDDMLLNNIMDTALSDVRGFLTSFERFVIR